MAEPSAIRVVRGPAGIALALAATVSLPSARADDAGLRSDLAVVSKRSVFFGHQSVGTNILEGVGKLASREGISLRVEEVPMASGLPAGVLAHGLMADNGYPLRKLESFQRALGQGPATSPDVALLKFCFVDFTPDTDVRSLFGRYQAVVQELQARHPGTTFVHATVPLTGVQGGFKGLVKRLLGKAPYGLSENARREEYNALVRAAYRDKGSLFDVARVESTYPDGRVETADLKGRAVPALIPSYTDDGGHLNLEGQLVVARELLAVLASVPVRGAPAPSAAR